MLRVALESKRLFLALRVLTQVGEVVQNSNNLALVELGFFCLRLRIVKATVNIMIPNISHWGDSGITKLSSIARIMVCSLWL